MADAKADEVLEVFADVPSTEIEAERFAAPGLPIAELMSADRAWRRRRARRRG